VVSVDPTSPLFLITPVPKPGGEIGDVQLASGERYQAAKAD
jgi:hypothetical protein